MRREKRGARREEGEERRKEGGGWEMGGRRAEGGWRRQGGRRRDESEVGGESNREIGFVSFVRACVRAAAAAACERAKLCARARESVLPPARAGTRQMSSGMSSGTPLLQSDLSS